MHGEHRAVSPRPDGPLFHDIDATKLCLFGAQTLDMQYLIISLSRSVLLQLSLLRTPGSPTAQCPRAVSGWDGEKTYLKS
jgi:hypothetical protein